MSRSWERKVRKNTAIVNKARKKAGNGKLVMNVEKKNEIRFTGRNYILPVVLILFIGMYNFLMLMDPNFKFDTMYWLTIVSYILLAALFYFRKPYLTIGKDYVQSRRMMGDKQLFAAAIKEIKIQSGYVIIVPNHGSSWTYSKLFNRFPLQDMTVELKKFAEKHEIKFTE
ncbi:MAG: hypothetical protein NAG76_19270 [Candidatus Pristimantibacillus lignocellulolyticus]|uniref:Uncharacterized protein n=1 Tax=Candidatus Pristimantibacillus lignocellulolyticus TaxID=2994561 RepID=A0A9J6ZCN4_9BACL|nr:MAG: hypothetical protein NAG76_19270 [Candidatus Pristimantibacillus lignocellulolyticus]